jgi:hypothetical protein
VEKYCLEQLPDDSFFGLWRRASAQSSLAAMIIGSAYSSRFESFDLREANAQLTPLPSKLMSSCLPHLCSALKMLDLSSMQVCNSVFEVIAGSAPHLATLRIPGSVITDESQNLWNSFQKLQEIDLSECPLINAATYESVIKLPKLIRIKVDQAASKIIVAKLPDQIESIEFIGKLGPGDTTAETLQLYQRLKERGTLPHLRSFTFLDWFLFNPRYLLELRQLYPTLETFHSPLDFVAIIYVGDFKTTLKDLIGVSFFFGSSRLQTEDAVELSRWCPNLRTLTLDVYLIDHDTSLWALSSVESLVISSCSHADRIKAWPSQLKSLEITGQHGMTRPIPDDFFTYIAYSCPNLEILKLPSFHGVTLDQVGYVLDNMKMLKTLHLPSTMTGRDHSKRRLPLLQDFSGNWAAASYLPSLEKLEVDSPLAVAQFLSAAKVPSLHSLAFSMAAFQSRNTNHPVLNDAFTAVASLTNLKSLSILGAPNSAQLGQLCQLTGLVSLAFAIDAAPPGDIIKTSHIDSILKALPCLRSFTFSRPAGCDLAALSSASVTTMQVAIVHDLPVVIGTGFPQLRSLEFVLSKNPNVTLSGCPNLQALHFKSLVPGTQNPDRLGPVCTMIRDCPKLTLISFGSLSGSLELHNLPELAHVSSDNKMSVLEKQNVPKY